MCAGRKPKVLGPDPFARGTFFLEIDGAQWARFVAAEGWGFNENKITEFIDQGPQIAFLAPEQSIQQKDATLGNEELKPELLINIVTGEVTFTRAGVVNFDNPPKPDPPPTHDPVETSIQLEEPHVDIDLEE